MMVGDKVVDNRGQRRYAVRVMTWGAWLLKHCDRLCLTTVHHHPTMTERTVSNMLFANFNQDFT